MRCNLNNNQLSFDVNYLFNMSKFTIILFFTCFMSSCSMLHISPSKKLSSLKFEQEAKKDYGFVFPKSDEDTMLLRLKKNYPLEDLVKNAKSEHEKVLLVLNWVRHRWEHNGWNDADTRNACTILERAEKGEKFRCVEYGIVLQSALNALGIKARTLGLMTRDVEVTKFGAGHVLSEVWLNDRQKWAMIDSQFDAMPILDGVPLNAVELQAAIIEKKPFKFIHLSGDLTAKETKDYMAFIPHYLYYFNVSFDERAMKREERHKIEGKSSLCLVPLGAKNPIIFQRKYPMNYFIYTNSVADFYRKP